MRSGRRRTVRLLLQLAGGLLLIAPSVVPFCLFGPRDAIYAIGSIREEFSPDSWPARCSIYAIYAFILSLPAMGSYVIVTALSAFRRTRRAPKTVQC